MPAPFVFNAAKGAWAYYASLPGTNDGLVAIPLEALGIEADDILQDYDTLADLLAGASNEQTTMGRQAIVNPTVTTDDVNNKRVFDFDDPSWPAASGNEVSRLLICYDPDTTAGVDADIIPLFCDIFAVTPSGVTITYQVDANGLADAA